MKMKNTPKRSVFALALLLIVGIALVSTQLVAAPPPPSTTFFVTYNMVRPFATKYLGGLTTFSISINATDGPIFIERLQLMFNQSVLSDSTQNIIISNINPDGLGVIKKNVGIIGGPNPPGPQYGEVFVAGLGVAVDLDILGNSAMVVSGGTSTHVSAIFTISLVNLSSFPTGTGVTVIATVLTAPNGPIVTLALP